MRTLMIVLVAASLLATPALADRTYEYCWNDGDNTILGTFDNCTADVTNEYNMPLHAGYGVALTKTTDVDSGYSTAFLACVWGLLPGDQVTASYWRYDNCVGYPRLRLWAHYNDSLVESDYRGQDLDLNDGLAYGNNSFGTESGWERFDVHLDHPGRPHRPGDRRGALRRLRRHPVRRRDVAHRAGPRLRAPARHLLRRQGEATAADPATWSNVKALFQ